MRIYCPCALLVGCQRTTYLTPSPSAGPKQLPKSSAPASCPWPMTSTVLPLTCVTYTHLYSPCHKYLQIINMLLRLAGRIILGRIFLGDCTRSADRIRTGASATCARNLLSTDDTQPCRTSVVIRRPDAHATACVLICRMAP